MQRFVLAFIFLALIAAGMAYLFRRLARSIERSDLSGGGITGGSMQKMSFFLLICLMVYVSLNGAV